jgi:hypothetical protein
MHVEFLAEILKEYLKMGIFLPAEYFTKTLKYINLGQVIQI